MQPPQDQPAGQPAYPGYGASPPAGQSPAPPDGGQVPQYGYYTPPYAPAVPTTATSGYAIASLVCSLASWFIIPFIGAVVGVVMGHMARGEIRRSYGQKSGGGLAIAGLVIGYIHIIVCILAVALIVVLALAFASDSAHY